MNEDTIINGEGVRELVRHILIRSTNNSPFDTESEELIDFLDEASYLTSDDLTDLSNQLRGGTTRRYKSRVRYLSALMPDKTLHELADSIHFVLDNNHISISDVREILRGEKRDIPVEKIQLIGKKLSEGESLRSISRTVKVSFDTVERIENFLGIAESRRLKLVDYACDAVRENWSIRRFAKAVNIPKSTAHSLMKKARSVLIELGEEVNEEDNIR